MYGAMDAFSWGSPTDTPLWPDRRASCQGGQETKKQKACPPGSRLLELPGGRVNAAVWILTLGAQDLGLLRACAGNER